MKKIKKFTLLEKWPKKKTDDVQKRKSFQKKTGFRAAVYF
jgi:hypothetical protein